MKPEITGGNRHHRSAKRLPWRTFGGNECNMLEWVWALRRDGRRS